MLATHPTSTTMNPTSIPAVSIIDMDKKAEISDSTSLPSSLSRPSLPSGQRSSFTLHKNILTRMRPLPFQYIYALWHTKATPNSNSETHTTHDSSTYTLTELSESIPDIATFYRIFNNFPWSSIALRDSVHFFRSGVKPQWEDMENLQGGCWTLKVRRDNNRALLVWEELCLMVCGGELQAAVAAQENDHVLGISYSPRQNWSHISIWTKDGGNTKSIEILQRTILTRLSPELRPASQAEYYYKKHAEHDGWKEVVSSLVKGQ